MLLFRRFAGGVWDSLCVSLCASAATFPVLVLRGMSTTVWAVASGVTVLWLVGPMLSFGLGAALLGLAAEGLPLFEIIRRPVAFCAEGLAWLMNEWAFRVSVLPGASLWFDGTYAALDLDRQKIIIPFHHCSHHCRTAQKTSQRCRDDRSCVVGSSCLLNHFL